MSAVWASITDKKVNLLTYDTNHETMKNLVKNLEKDELKVPIAKEFDSLEKVFDAMDFLMNSNKSVLGKLVIKVQQ
jgi:NADPH:quinone reductase-like Zn-dependent oxidoreductase